jgi:hypothetical protein
MTSNTTLPTPVSLPAEPNAARYVVGEVVEAEDDACLVNVEQRLLEARRALSCLIGVERGDRVAVLVEAAGLAHIVAVLERSAQGALEIATTRDFSIRSRGELSLRAVRLSTIAERTSMVVGRLRVVATEIVAESRALRLVAHISHTIVDSLHLIAQRSFRHVEESDHQRCGYLDLEAEQLLQIKARNTMISSQQLTRVDGAQIHVG